MTDKPAGPDNPIMTIVSTETVERDGKPWIKSIRQIDWGPKYGVTTVELWDPCVTPEAQERRRERIRQKCIELYRRGEILAST